MKTRFTEPETWMEMARHFAFHNRTGEWIGPPQPRGVLSLLWDYYVGGWVPVSMALDMMDRLDAWTARTDHRPLRVGDDEGAGALEMVCVWLCLESRVGQ